MPAMIICPVPSFLVRPGLRLDRHADDRLREVHLLQQDRMVHVADGVPGSDRLEPHRGDDIARPRLFDLLTLVRVHLQETPEALFLVPGRIQHVAARAQRPAVDPQVGQLAYVRVRLNLEGQRRERLVSSDRSLDHFLGCRIDSRHGRHVGRRRKEIDHCIEQPLDSLVPEGAPAQDRDEQRLSGGATDRTDKLFARGLPLVRVDLEELLVDLGQGLDQLEPGRLRFAAEVLGDIHLLPGGAEVLLAEDQGLLLDQIDETVEGLPRADRELHRVRVRPQALPHHRDHVGEIRSHAIHLVHEGEPGHPVLVRLSPDRFRLGLHTPDRAKYRHRSVEDPQAPLDFHGKINMPWRVDDVDLMLTPAAGGRG
jgi:hypothetical protein